MHIYNARAQKYAFFLLITFYNSIPLSALHQEKSPASQQVLCRPEVRSSSQCGVCSVDQWAQKVFSLKELPVQMSTLPKTEIYQKNVLTRTEFLESIEQMAALIKESCSDKKTWLNTISLQAVKPEIFNLSRQIIKDKTEQNFIFKPYAQRLIVPQGSTIAFFGDFHGSAHSFVRDILKLKQENYIDNNFKITKNNFYMVFLGDYTDRGIYGVEVMYTLARLKIANPERVFITRGNHEDYTIALSFKKKYAHLEPKDMLPNFLDELHQKFALTKEEEIFIYRLYDILPVVLYLGSGTKQQVDFIHCCHGGLEIGYDPYALIHAPDTVRFELIKTLKRKTYFYKKLTKQQQNIIKKNFDIHYLCKELQDIELPSPVYEFPGTEQKTYLGFMWGDFFVDPSKEVGPRPTNLTGWVYGSKLTYALLDWGTSGHRTLRAIYRAHQHNNETGGPMLDLLCCNKGFVSVWKNKKLFNFLSAPSSKLDNTGESCFTYDSFVLLTTAAHYAQWQFKHYYQDITLQKKIWQTRMLK